MVGITTNNPTAMSGLVIYPGYSWLGASPDGVVHDPGCTDPNGLLEIKCIVITVTTPLFKPHLRRGYVVCWKRVSCFKRTPPLLLSSARTDAICNRKRSGFVVFTNAGISLQRIFLMEYFGLVWLLN